MEEVYNAKLPTVIKELSCALPRTLIRMWIMQRLEAEQSNIEPVPGIEVGATTPGTDRQPNHKGVIVDGITS